MDKADALNKRVSAFCVDSVFIGFRRNVLDGTLKSAEMRAFCSSVKYYDYHVTTF